MAELDKVIKGLAHCTRPSEVGKGGNFCMDCPYTEPIGFSQFKCNSQQLMKDALELLKEYKRKDECPCTHCQEYACEAVCNEYKKWHKSYME